MCGIVGILRTSDAPLPSPRVLRRMVASVEYRGPNGTGEFIDHDIQLGVVRLAIIDLKNGHQPVFGSDKRTVAVYNGEIYNYQSLRRELRDLGHHLRNECDSTVLPHLYEERGPKMVDALRGMFAFAVWDTRNRRLLLARDRLGIKPLYWAQTSDYLVFASEIKAIFASGLVPRRIDRASVDDLFSLSYPCPPRTMFEGVRELRPGHLALAHAGERMKEPQRYWRVPFPHRGEHRRGKPEDFAQELREQLRRKVYDHLQSDVRVGVYLSGGLDSSAIASTVKEVTGDAPTTFTIGFASEEHDERSYATQMIEALGTENHELVCDASLAAEYPRMIWHTELPLQYPIGLPLLQLAGLARSQGFPVILTGEGADETMGGYDCFRVQKMRRFFERPILRRFRAPAYRRVYRWLDTPIGLAETWIKLQERPSNEVRRAFAGAHPPWYEVWQLMDVERSQLLSPDGREVRPTTEAPEGFSSLVREDIAELDPLDAELSVELETRLPSWILLIGDRVAMANGVETRVPFMDHEIVEAVAALPPSVKMRGFVEKAVLRSAMKGLLPEPIRKRPKKPFYTPLRDWFFGREAPEYVEEILSERALRDAGLFAPEVVKKLRQDLQLVPAKHIQRSQLEWVLVQVLGTQLLHHLFVADFAGLKGPSGYAVAETA